MSTLKKKGILTTEEIAHTLIAADNGDTTHSRDVLQRLADELNRRLNRYHITFGTMIEWVERMSPTLRNALTYDTALPRGWRLRMEDASGYRQQKFVWLYTENNGSFPYPLTDEARDAIKAHNDAYGTRYPTDMPVIRLNWTDDE